MNEKQIWDCLLSALGNPYGVAGLMGNIQAESGLRSNNMQNSYEKKLGLSDTEYTQAVDNGSYTCFASDRVGYGLCQWTSAGRKKALLKYCKKCGASIADSKMQLDFLTMELSNGYKKVLEVLKNAKSVREASDMVLIKFEAPADQSDKVQKLRASYGQAYYNKYAAKQSNTADNKISKLHPILQYKLKKLLALCDANNLKIGISECLRTVAEQDALYAKGRTAKGNIVTNAKGSTYSSMHQWGIAFDFYRNDGKGSYYDNDGFFSKVGQLGKSIGLEWGGDWKSIVDKPHFQLPYWGSGAGTLKTKYGTPQKFDDYWYPGKPTETVKQGSCRDDVLWVQLQICKLTSINLVPDGVYGPKTADAITKYQQMLGWDGTGKAGVKTIAALAKGRVA